MSRIRRPNREYAIEKLRELISAGLGEEDEAILQKLESSSDDSSVASQEGGAPDDDDNDETTTFKTAANSKTTKKKKSGGSDDDDSDYSIKSDAYGQQDDSDVDSSFDDTEDSKELISSSDGDDVHGKKRKKPKKASKAEKEAQRQIRNENREGKEKRKGDSASKKGGTLGEVRLRNAAKVFTHAQRMEMALTRAKEQTILLRKMEEDASAAIANDEATAADLMALSSKKGRATRKTAVKKKVKSGGKRGRNGKKKGGGGEDSDSNESEGGNEDSKANQAAIICEDACSGGFLGGGARQVFIGLSQSLFGVVSNVGKSPGKLQPTHTSLSQLQHIPSGSSSDLLSDHNFECSDTPSFTFEERRRLGLNTVREHRKLVNRRRLRNRRLQEGGGKQSFTSTRTFPLVAA